jgi:hypothetical protein
MTTDAKFTPGPWDVESPFGDEALAIVANADKPTYAWKIVASCFSKDEYDDENGVPLLEHNANARLIAAAPEMYEALRSIADSVHADSGSRKTSFKALAKARGETR